MSQQYYYPSVSVTIPAGGATAANQVLQLAQETAISGKLPATLGTKASAASLSVVLASDQATLTVTGPLTDTQLRATPVPISGTVSTGGLTDTQLRASPVPVSLTSTTVTGSVAVTGPLTDTQLRATPVPVSGTVSTGGLTDTQLRATAVPVSLAANQSVNNAQINGVTPLMGAGPTGTGSQRVTVSNIASATLANVSSSASTGTLLASGAARMGASFQNESTATLYLKYGATASLTSYTVAIPPGGYFELPQPCYSGVIDGIWSAANGTCRVTSW